MAGAPPDGPAVATGPRPVRSRYGFLMLYGQLAGLAGVLVLIVTLIVVVLATDDYEGSTRTAVIVLGLLVGALSALSWFAVAQGVRLMLDLKEDVEALRDR